MSRLDEDVYAAMLRRGMSRRSFIKFCGAMAAALALPAAYAPRIAAAVATAPRMPVIWLRGQSCGGDSAAFLGATDPTATELLLDILSVDYHQMLMAPSGAAADLSLLGTLEMHPRGYIAIVEGGIPTADDGVYSTTGGRPFADIVREVCDGALVTIAVGSCASDGGIPAAAGGPTGAVGVTRVAPDAPLVNLPGCPVNVKNLTATIVHYLTFKQLPATDAKRRPLFAYGGLIHNQCERRAHFEFGEFVLAWGDEAAQKGWCLYKMGCKGPETSASCPTTRYADGLSWPVRAGHGCVGCTMPRSWDAMSPFYQRLPPPLPFASAVTVDQVGQAMVAGVGAMTMVHGAASVVRQRRIGAAERRAATVALPPAPAEPPSAVIAADPAGATDPVIAADRSVPPAPVESPTDPVIAADPAVLLDPAGATDPDPSLAD